MEIVNQIRELLIGGVRHRRTRNSSEIVPLLIL